VVARVFIFLFLAVVVSCQESGTLDSPFHKEKALGVNNNERLEEASGLAASAMYPGFLWSHNDSGHPPVLFLLDSVGQTRAEFRLAKIKNRDWEDIAIGPGPDGKKYIYIGDIGDNYARYPCKYIYRLEEPSILQEGKIHAFDTLIVRLSDEVRDTETLMVDPITNNIYLVSKRDKDVGLYEVPFPFLRDTLEANRVATLSLRHIVGGDISVDGTEILLKNYEHIYYWKRGNGESLRDVLLRPGIKLSYHREKMGEAITWARDGSGFYTLGENAKGERARLYFYARKEHVKDSAQAIP